MARPSGCAPATQLSPHRSQGQDEGVAGGSASKPHLLSSVASPCTDPYPSSQSLGEWRGKSPENPAVIREHFPEVCDWETRGRDGTWGLGICDCRGAGFPAWTSGILGGLFFAVGAVPGTFDPYPLEAKHSHPSCDNQRCLPAPLEVEKRCFTTGQRRPGLEASEESSTADAGSWLRPKAVIRKTCTPCHRGSTGSGRTWTFPTYRVVKILGTVSLVRGQSAPPSVVSCGQCLGRALVE